MHAEKIRSLCLSLKGVEESIKWENHLCFTIGEKMFLILNPDNTPVNGSFKTSPAEFDLLTGREGFIPAPYLARYSWVQFDNINRLSEKDWKKYMEMAYRLVYDKLPAKAKMKLSKIS